MSQQYGELKFSKKEISSTIFTKKMSVFGFDWKYDKLVLFYFIFILKKN